MAASCKLVLAVDILIGVNDNHIVSIAEGNYTLCVQAHTVANGSLIYFLFHVLHSFALAYILLAVYYVESAALTSLHLAALQVVGSGALAHGGGLSLNALGVIATKAEREGRGQ